MIFWGWSFNSPLNTGTENESTILDQELDSIQVLSMELFYKRYDFYFFKNCCCQNSLDAYPMIW